MVACSPKSNACYAGIDEALEDCGTKSAAVPMHLRDAHYKGAQELGHGKGYKYSHDYPMANAVQPYLPPEFANKRYYRPKNSGYEAKIRQRLVQLKGDQDI